jgi:hypothetical protein
VKFSRSRPLVLFGFALFTEHGQVEVWESDDAGLMVPCAEFAGTGASAWVSAFRWVLQHRADQGCG